MRAHDNKDILVRNVKNILTHNKSSSADYFAADYGLDNIIVNMNKHYLLDEALKLNLPVKNIKATKIIQFPLVRLEDELDISEYNELQRTILLKIQDILQTQALTEDKLLEYERRDLQRKAGSIPSRFVLRAKTAKEQFLKY